MKKKVLYITYIHCIYVLSEHVATRLTEVSISDTYVHIYMHTYIVHTYTFIHIRSYIVHTSFIRSFIHTYIHTYIYVHMSTCITKEGKKEICNKYVLMFLTTSKVSMYMRPRSSSKSKFHVRFSCPLMYTITSCSNTAVVIKRFASLYGSIPSSHRNP